MSDATTTPGPAFQPKAWNGWIALSAFLGTFTIVEILGNMSALSIIMSLHPELRAHWSTAKFVESPSDVVIETTVWMIAAFAAFVLLRLVLGITPASIGLTVPKGAQVLFGLASGIGLLVISFIVLAAQSRLIGQHAIKAAAYFIGHHGLAAYAADLLQAVVTAPFLEELLFRGLLFTALVQRMPVWLAALVSACLFGLSPGSVCLSVPRGRRCWFGVHLLQHAQPLGFGGGALHDQSDRAHRHLPYRHAATTLSSHLDRFGRSAFDEEHVRR